MFSAVTLTTAFSGNRKTVKSGGMSQGTLYIAYTTGAGGAGNNVDIQLDFSNDGTTWYQESSSSTTTGTTTLYNHTYTFDGAASATAYYLRIPFAVADKYIRISLKETVVGGSAGTVTSYLELSGK